MTTQLEALRLAEVAPYLEGGERGQWIMSAAAELRRLHEELAEWRVAVTNAERERDIAEEQRNALLEALKNVTVHLIAAHGLLHRGGKKAAASDAMFSMMLADYEKSFEVGRAAVNKAKRTTT